MKKIFSIRSLFIAGLFSVLLTSCATASKMRADISESRDQQYKAFVQTLDGKIYDADEVRLRQPFLGKSTIELDKDIRIPVKEIRAYQNATAYMMRTPHGFAPRIKKGLINVYLASYTVAQADPSDVRRTRYRTINVYYLQKGDEAALREMSPDAVEEMVRDYPPALAFMEEYRQVQRKVKTWSIINTTAFVGGFAMAASGGVNGKVTGVNYAGAAIGLAGLGNGFANKIRRAKNYRNLELAIDEYNRGGGNRSKRRKQ